MAEAMVINPPMTKERARRMRCNAKELEQRRARIRSDPTHPSHMFPDEMIHTICDQTVEQRRALNKDTMDRDDIVCAVLCEKYNSMYGSRIPTGVKGYLRVMITIYMNPKYPAVVTDRYRRVWAI